ncbi:MAG: type IV pilus biogenesis protein PilM [Candidatus Methylomirabilales bacterium]
MAWGLDIEADRLRLCAAAAAGGRVRLQRWGEAAVPAGLLQPSLTAPNLPDAAALGRILLGLAREVRCRGWVRVALPDDVFSLRTLLTDDLPPEPAEARRFLRWQARDLLPFPAEETRLDFVAGLPPADGRQRIVCLMARERVLADYERLLAEAGLHAARLDARSVALAQAASRRLGSRTAGLVSLAAGRLTILVVEAGLPRFRRTLAGAPDDAARDRLLREVADSLAFCRESEGTAPVEELLLDAPAGLGDGLAAELSAWLEIPVSPLQPAALGLAAGAKLADPPRWGAAIGAAVAPC